MQNLFFELIRVAIGSQSNLSRLPIQQVHDYRNHQSIKAKIKRNVKTVLYYLPLSVTKCLKRFL